MDKKHIIAILALALCTALGIAAASALSGAKAPGQTGTTGPDDFSFALTWNAYGVSSYDSATGVLVKTTDATHPEDYVTEYHLTEQELAQVRRLISDLKPETYPVTYNPNPNVFQEPPETLILTVRTAEGEKTIAARGVALAPEGMDAEGKRFADTCRSIEHLLTATDAWQALPEYEVFYE